MSGSEAGVEGAREVLGEAQKELPADIADETTCKIQKAARQFRAQLRVVAQEAGSPVGRSPTCSHVGPRVEDHPEVVGRLRAEKKRFKTVIEPLHADFRADDRHAVPERLAPVRLPAVRHAAHAGARVRRHRAAPANSLNYGDLLILTAKVLRENAAVRRALAAEVPVSVRRRVPGHGSGSGRDRVPAGRGRGTLSRPASAGATEASRTGGRCRLRPGALVRRRRSEAIDLSLPPRRHRDLQHRPRALRDPSIGRVLPLTTNFRSVPALCEWANEVFDGPFPAQPTPHSPRFARWIRRKAGRPRLGGIFTLTLRR